MAKAGLLFVGTDDGLVLFSDPGASGRWLRVGQELRGEQILAVWPLYDNLQTVVAGGPNGLWQSTDGGASWQKQTDTPVSSFTGSKDQPDIVTLHAIDRSVQRSEDGGATWHAAPDEAADITNTHVTLAGRNPVMLAIQNNSVVRSEDNGATRQQTTVDQPWDGEITVVVPARYHIDTAFAGTTAGQLAVSSDRGRTWHVIKSGLPAIRSIVAARLA